ncbi:hypothetical protein C8Q76DRAFT_799883 [Earliella scabrosa]|nr:hypothetical protein C8Q76DRAFT_799883 [Earliella scabrosa]
MPRSGNRWNFENLRTQATFCKHTNALLVRIISVIESVALDDIDPHLRIFPLFEADAVRASSTFSSVDEFDEAVHLDGERPATLVKIYAAPVPTEEPDGIYHGRTTTPVRNHLLMASARMRPRSPSPDCPAKRQRGSDDVQNVATLDNAIQVPAWIRCRETDRLQAILDHDDGVSTFALAKISPAATWGVGTDHECMTTQGKPTTVWLCGPLRAMAFGASSEGTHTMNSITLDLLRTVDRNAMVRLRQRSRPVPRSNIVPATVTATQKRGLTCSNTLFPEVYDACSFYSGKDTMPKLSVAHLAIGDIVLVEATLHRRKLEPAVTEWVMWRTEFEFHSIALVLPRDRAM